MKNNILIIGLAGLLGLSSALTSCSPDYETEFNVETLVVPDKSQAPITFPLTGGEHEIVVQTNVPTERWNATSNAEWCKIEKQDGKVLVSAGANNIYKQRKAEITIEYGHQSYPITVSQFGKEPAILIGDDLKQEGHIEIIDAEREMLTIPIATNLNLDNIIIPDTCNWIRLAEQPKAFDAKNRAAEDVNKQELKFTLDKSTETAIRYCTVILQSSQNYSYAASFLIKQQPRGYIVEIDDEHKVYEVKAMGGTITVPFQVNSPAGEMSYTYEIEASAQSWITPVSAPVSRALRDVAESFLIGPNTEVEHQPREGKITFKSKNSTDKVPSQFTVTVKQAEFVATPPVNVTNAVATPLEGRIKLDWEIPVDVDFSKIKVTYTDPVTKEDKEIVIDDYSTTSCTIEDTYQCAGEYTFTIKTYGPTGMETDSPVIVKGTSGEAQEKELVPLTIDMLSANATEPQEGKLEYLIDNSTGVNDFYHTMWSQVQPNQEAHYIQISLHKPLQNLRFEYHSRRNSGSGDVKRANIYGSNNASDPDSWEIMGTETYTPLPTPVKEGNHIAPNENISGRQAYRYIRFTPTATRQNDPLVASDKNKAWWNMAKIYLYRIRHDEAWAKEQLGI